MEKDGEWQEGKCEECKENSENGEYEYRSYLAEMREAAGDDSYDFDNLNNKIKVASCSKRTQAALYALHFLRAVKRSYAQKFKKCA